MRHLWKRGAQDYHILKVEDARRKLEEEDQVIYDCYSIPSNQLIALLPFLCPPVNTHPQDALTQQLPFLLPSLLIVFALNTSFHLFRFLPCISVLSPSTWWSRCLRSQSGTAFMIPGCSYRLKEAYKNNAPASFTDIAPLWSQDVVPAWDNVCKISEM